MSYTKDDLHVVYHVASMGNWKAVVDEQLAILCKVGLTSVLVTHVGEDLEWLVARFKSAGIDAVVKRHDENVNHYETFAMLLVEELVRDSDKPVLYFHTKGVSNPEDHRKGAWRRLMSSWVVERWRENLDLLRDHDAVGVDWLQCDHSHFVGNFWIATAAYLRRQEPFTTFHSNMRMVRFSCEFWVGWGNPKVHSHVCSNKVWWDLVRDHQHDLAGQLDRAWLVTPAFCRSEMLADCLDNLYNCDQPVSGIEHTIIDAHYPLAERSDVRSLADQYGCRYLDSGRDRGLQGNLNLFIETVGARRGDVLLGCDPDDRPQPGWCSAVRKVLTEHRWIGVLALSWSLIHSQQIVDGRYREEVHSGHRVWLCPSNEMIRVIGLQLGFVIDNGGFQQPFKYYGGIDGSYYQQRLTEGLHLAYLPDFTCDWRILDRTTGARPGDAGPSKLADVEYREWKDAHLSGFEGSFADWLAENRPDLLLGKEVAHA